tara:strand:- start:1043 stop:1366 length:324 start_codon:yes stop_codon:yes gene_type:complete
MYGDILSKFIFYVFILQKHGNKSPILQQESNQIIECIQNLIHQIETLLIENRESKSIPFEVYSDIETIWEETINYVLPYLVLEQLSRTPVIDKPESCMIDDDVDYVE